MEKANSWSMDAHKTLNTPYDLDIILCHNAKDFSIQIKEQGFTLLNKVVFNQVLICCEEEKITKAVLENIQSEGTCWCGSTTWQGKTAIRVSICSWATTAEDINLSVQAFGHARKETVYP